MVAADASTTPTQVALPEAIEMVGGQSQFSAYWAGSSVQADGTINVYVTAAGAGALTAALGTDVGPPSLGYHVVTVQRSYADLQSLTQQIASNLPDPESTDINIYRFGPDPATNTVKIELENYTASAANALQATFGDAVSVVPAANVVTPITPAGRSNDTPPYWAGDPLFMNNNRNELCTLGWAFIGNESGDDFSGTAGHCGPPQWDAYTNYDNSTLVATQSDNYWNPPGSTLDITSLRPVVAGNFDSPAVWYNQNDNHVVVGWNNFESGLVTMDGFTQDEQPDWSIESYDQCYPAKDWSDLYERCDISEAYNADRTSCYAGDSGGPVYQRAADNEVYAAGLIIGGSRDNHTCFYFGIGQYLSLVDGSLIIYK